MISQRPFVLTGYDEPEGDRFDQPSISLDEIAAFFEVDRSTARDWLYDAGVSPLVFLHRGELTLRYCPYAIDNWLQSERPSQLNAALPPSMLSSPQPSSCTFVLNASDLRAIQARNQRGERR